VTRENVEIVRRFSDCWARQDWDLMAELCDPNVEQHGTVGGVEEGRVLRGVSEIRRDYEAVEETWDEHRVEPQQLIDAGDRVVLFHREYQRGRSSGVELMIELAAVFELKDGRIVRVQGYMDRAEALAAVGLSEQDDHA
jgi:ketosteroid isomerase-like protein